MRRFANRLNISIIPGNRYSPRAIRISWLISGTVENAMNLLNISPFAQYVVRG
ncbi:hypothetical protein PX87_002031 [Salmonella enterica subsp. enterica serovar Java]|nr:hypothetical protein [Salmonella enterica subsp. enterica serovar Java]EDW4343058.1 hypothetical protein [Salmonella enterica subsp. enterica]EDV3514701.1 hypothetical protein [Salmonella enterica subsp. enterica serovar Java]EDV9871411.1 hypothetical protein [Salmonella enterica subsp. enterica serovar Java]EDV9928741.1 hypothetical protein [Salmonella enterica subsp. enterica serovar Java]